MLCVHQNVADCRQYGSAGQMSVADQQKTYSIIISVYRELHGLLYQKKPLTGKKPHYV